MRNLSRRLLQHRVIAIVLVTLVTLGLVGVVVVTTTSVGCSLARSLTVKSTKCVETPVAALGSPSPTPLASIPSNPPSLPSANPPDNPGFSSNPPYEPGSSPADPFAGPNSSGYPPMVGPASPSAGLGVALSCRLPIYAGGPGSGGFIVFPGSTFVADPRSAVTAPSPSPGTASPTPRGPGYAGWWGLTYDARYSKWLPVPWAWASPDGSHYAYPLDGGIYVQSVSGGAQLVLGQGQAYGVVAVENDGVYVAPAALPTPGLWFLPYSGAAKQITASGFWGAASHAVAYGTSTSAVPQGATNTVLRLDLTSGATTPFFSQPGGQSQVTGFDVDGHPVIETTYPEGVILFLVSGPQTYKAIAGRNNNAYAMPQPLPQGTPIGDAHGLWYSVGSYFALYANGSWYGMTTIGGQLAGPCL